MKRQILFLLYFSISTVFIPNNLHSQWIDIHLPSNECQTLGQYNSNIFAGGYNTNILYFTSDLGNNWIPIINKLVETIIVVDTVMFFGCDDYGVYVSFNGGQSWNQTSLNNQSVKSLATNNSYVYARASDGLYLSSNCGQNWHCILYDQAMFWTSVSAFNSTVLVAASNGILRSTNNGDNWMQTLFVPGVFVTSITMNGSYVFAGTDSSYIHTGKLYRSTNDGLNWSIIHIGGTYCILSENSFLFAGGIGYLEYSYNNGDNWIDIAEGLPGYYHTQSLRISSNYLFDGNGWGVFRRPLSEITLLNKSDKTINNFLSLSQNFPNPFNPVTKIKFDIPKEPLPFGEGKGGGVFIKLIIYDILGREVATLVNEQLKPGTYEYEWDGSNFASGIYFYKLITDDFSQTRKMVLIK